MTAMDARPDWRPFCLAPSGAHADAPRSIHTREGVGDRLRAAAFAEIQAREAFTWACHRFAEEAPTELLGAWKMLARAEDKHLGWLLTRLEELGFAVDERRVSDFLWDSFMKCESAAQFAHFMASAEERGKRAGERFHATLQEKDPVSAEIFRKIAEEEVEHIALASKFFGPSIETRLGTTSA